MMTVAVVTGANSGIGRATAIHLSVNGFDVYGTVRDPSRAEKLNAMAADAGATVNLVMMDVADDASVKAGIGEILDRSGRIDALVNNAGVGGNAVIEEVTTAEMSDVFNVNVNGAVRCIQAVLPGMRERGNGVIVNITSVAGRFGAIGQAPYTTSKWAFEGFSEELAFELAPLGIRVVIVEPGVTKSAIFAKNQEAPNATGAYDMHYRRLFDFYAAGIAEATDPFEVAEVIRHAITTDKPLLRYACAWAGAEIIEGRKAMTDEDWVELGALTDDNAYAKAFEAAFGVTPRPST
jgi:NAD(P)-dependent dehydrogenase (short-subunit alcohol dehydrogenase family)